MSFLPRHRDFLRWGVVALLLSVGVGFWWQQPEKPRWVNDHWRLPPGATRFEWAMIGDRTVVFVASERSEAPAPPVYVVAVATKTGRELWRWSVSTAFGDTAAVEEIVTDEAGDVYVAVRDGGVVKLSGGSGAIRWHHGLGDAEGSRPLVYRLAWSDGRVSALTSNGVCSLDANTGALVWRWTSEAGFRLSTREFAIGPSGDVFAYGTGVENAPRAPAKIWCLGRSSGAERWGKRVADVSGRPVSSIVGLSAVRPDGLVAISVPSGSSFRDLLRKERASPNPNSSFVCVVGEDPRWLCWDAATGRAREAVRLPWNEKAGSDGWQVSRDGEFCQLAEGREDRRILEFAVFVRSFGQIRSYRSVNVAALKVNRYALANGNFLRADLLATRAVADQADGVISGAGFFPDGARWWQWKISETTPVRRDPILNVGGEGQRLRQLLDSRGAIVRADAPIKAVKGRARGPVVAVGFPRRREDSPALWLIGW